MLRYAAQPSPKHHAKACAIMKIGKTTPVAAFPRALSSLLPMKIWSTMLYSALTKSDNTHGTENLSISFDIFSVPKETLKNFV